MNKSLQCRILVTAIIILLFLLQITVSKVEASIIKITSPTNNTLYNTNSLPMTINITLGETTNTSSIAYVKYETSWQPNNTTTIFEFDGGFYRDLMVQLAYPRTLEQPISKLFQTVTLTEIPEGNHNITIYTKIWHYSSMRKEKSVFEYYYAYTDLTREIFTDTIFFGIDTTSPIVTFPSLDNKTYTSPDVTLNCTVSEKVSQLTYSLDGQEQVHCPVLEVSGNLIGNDSFSVFGKPVLANLTDGEHSIVFYATDEAGNVGVSETLYFIVDTPEPFPTTIVLASVAIVATVGAGLLVYFKKRKH